MVSGAFLLIQSFWQLTHTDPGFRSQGVLTASFINRGMSPEEGRQGMQHFLERIEARPDVDAAGIVDFLPLEFGWSNTTKSRAGWVEGSPPPNPDGELKLELRVASAGYFRAMSIPLLEGRLFEETDFAEAPGVVLVSERSAQARERSPVEDAAGWVPYRRRSPRRRPRSPR